jgi:DNA-binding CsgD family transcriptional regulator
LLVLSLRVLRSESPRALLERIIAEEPFADAYWVGVQTRAGILVTGVTIRSVHILRIPGLPSTLPVLRSPAAATAHSVAPFLEAMMAQTPWRTIAVAPVPTSVPCPIMIGACASGEMLPLYSAGILKLLAETAAVLGHLLALARLARLNEALTAQSQALKPWLIAEDDRILSASPEAWRTVETLWRQESLDLKSDFARLPIGLCSTIGLDLPIQLGKTSARIAIRKAAFIPDLLTFTFSLPGQPGLDLEKLTATEHKILSLVLEGLSNRAIAEHLGRSIATIQNHVHAILAKLNAGDRRQLLLRAGRGITRPITVPPLEPVSNLGPPPILRKPFKLPS